jgi:site-specific DNA-methyltransferase (adenine-specific)/modification methylase
MSRVERIGDATLYLGDSSAMVDDLLAVADILLGDPPYGKGYKVNARRSRATPLDAIASTRSEAAPAIHGDDQPFDPEPWLSPKMTALCGANHFSSRLPDGGRWIVWDKRRHMTPDDHSDCELVWTNRPGADRIHRQVWRGLVREGEENCSNSKKLHQNQKPIALMDFVLDQLGAEPGQTVVDPWMGSGTVGVAAIRRGLRYIGVEIDPMHFETACGRLRVERYQPALFGQMSDKQGGG